MITKEEMLLILEREGIDDFIFPRTCDKETNIYETANGYYCLPLKIFPAPYVGAETEKKVSAFLSLDFPPDTVVQFITYSSRNISDQITAYKKIHMNPENDQYKKANIGNKLFLDVMAESGVEWLKKYSNESIFANKNIDFFLRDFINLCVVMVPRKKQDGSIRTKAEITSLFAQVKGGMSDFAPRDFKQGEYVRFMREILNPGFPMWAPPSDTMTSLNAQIVDSRSAVEVDLNGRIVFGTLSNNDGSRIDLKTQVEPPRMLKFKIQKFLKDKFNFGEVQQSKRNINPEWYCNVLTTKMFPEYIDLGSTHNLLMDYFNYRPQGLIPIPFMMSLTISVGERNAMVKDLMQDAKWNMFQLSNAAGAAKYMPELRDRVIEAKNIVNLVDRGGEIPFKAMWSVSLFSKSEDMLDRYTSTFQKEFLSKNWRLQKEEQIALPVLLFSLPMQYDPIFQNFSKRFNTLFRANNASITPLMTDSKGFGLPVIQTVGRNGQLQGLDIFDRSATNKNFVTIAPSGSGKSYFMAFFFLNYLMYGAKIRVIDSGESYLRLCNLVGGLYVRFDENSNLCLNFFSDIAVNDSGEIKEEAIESIIPIIGMMAKIDFNANNTSSSDSMDTSVLSSYVADAIKDAYAMAGSDAGMKEVGIALNQAYARQKRDLSGGNSFNHDVDSKLRDLIKAINPYCDEKGEYYSYFNGKKNLSFSDNDFVVMEMLELETKGNFRNVVLMSLAYAVEYEFYRDDRRKKKILAIDEAWSLLDNIIVARFIEGLYRKARKFAGAVGTITQTINDYHKNPVVKSMYENAYWKFFLQPDKEALDNAINDKKFSVDPFTLKLMHSVRTDPGTYSELMIKTSSNSISIGRLISTRALHWVFTTQDVEVGTILNVSEHFGVDTTTAALAIGLAEDKSISLEDSFVEIARLQGKGPQGIASLLSEDEMLSDELIELLKDDVEDV